MARGCSKAVTLQQKQTDSLPSLNILNTSQETTSKQSLKMKRDRTPAQ